MKIVMPAFIAAFLLLTTSCESMNDWLRERDFEIAVYNRVNVQIQIAIDGEWFTTISPQNFLQFKITKKYEDSWDTWNDGTIYAVTTTFAARSDPASQTTAPQLSKTKKVTLKTDKVTSVTFDVNDW